MVRRRVLICGRLFAPGRGGGLQLALEDVAAALTATGWNVDLAITPAALDLENISGCDTHIEGLGGARWARLPRFRSLPDDARAVLQHVLLDGGFARAQSRLFGALESRLTQCRYDAVIACVPREAPGIASFIAELHPNVLLLSLEGLGGELRRARWLPLPRLLARARALHPALYRPVDPGRVRMVVFASDTWRDEAVRAGLPPSVCRTIYFGLRNAPPLASMKPVQNRLLWVGRLSREKGLHHFIEAVAMMRRSRPVVLNAICGPGPADYRASIERRIRDCGLQAVVRLHPPVPRAGLLAQYQGHDALLFHSVFAEPVALVAAEAFAAGLPVIASMPRGRSALIKPGETAQCFASAAPEAICEAIDSVLDDDGLRGRLRRAAYDLAGRDFSLAAMGAAYDAALQSLLRGAA